MNHKPTKILIAGEGGQGVQTIAQILAYAAREQGFNTTYIPNFGVEQRGGVSLAFVRISKNPIAYPKFKTADILVVLCDRAVKRTQNYAGPETIYIFDDSLVHKENLRVREHSQDLSKSSFQTVNDILHIPASRIAKHNLVPKTFNMIILGVLTQLIGRVTDEKIIEVIDEKLGAKLKDKPELLDLDIKALQLGVRLAKEGYGEGKAGEAPRVKEKVNYVGEKGLVEHFPKYCKSCGLCLVKCPVGAISWSKNLGFLGTPVPKVDTQKCIACGNCERICPECAFKVKPAKQD